MRNAVIRKKALKDQALIRKYLFTPQRFIIETPIEHFDGVDWRKMAQPIWGNVR